VFSPNRLIYTIRVTLQNVVNRPAAKIKITPILFRMGICSAKIFGIGSAISIKSKARMKPVRVSKSAKNRPTQGASCYNIPADV
jgi:hypothetical protein